MPSSAAPTGVPAGAHTGAYAVLLLTVFVDMVGFGIIIPLLPFWAKHFQATAFEVGLLMSVYSGFQFVFAFFWGWLSDRWGRKPVLLISLFGSVASFLLVGLAESLWMLFAARALGGVMGANISVAQAYIADVTPPDRRAKGMGMLGAAFGMGFVIGPGLGGWMSGGDPASPDYRIPFYIAAGMSSLAFVLGTVFLREPARHAAVELPRDPVERLRAFAMVVANPAVALPIAIAVVMGFAMAGLESTYALWLGDAHGWGGRETGFFFMYIGVLLVFTQGRLVGVLVRRTSEARVLAIGVAVMVLGFTLVPLSLTLPLVLLNGCLVALGFGLGSPALNALTSRNAPAEQQGAVMGALQSGQSLARVAGPAFAGLLFHKLGRDAPYLAGAAILLAVLALVLKIVRREAAARRAAE